MAALGWTRTGSRTHPRSFTPLHGFGNGGAYSGDPAYDDTIQGLSGIADIVARQSGEPRYLPTIAADKTCGLVAAHAILAALFQRERTGQGQFVEIPMFESMASYTLVEHFYGRHLVDAGEPAGDPRLLSAWRRPYQTRDGYLCIMPYTDTHWQRFFAGTGHPEWANDPRFTSISARTQHIDALYEITGTLMRERDSAEWLAFFADHEIPATRVNTLEDLERDAHLKSVDFFVDLRDPQENTYRFTRNPVRMEQSVVPVAMPPRLGQHTREVLAEAGLSADTIDNLLRSGAAKHHAKL